MKLLSSYVVILVSLFTMTSSSLTQTYVDVAAQMGITASVADGEVCDPPPVHASGSAWEDYDNDGDVDLYVTNNGGVNWLYRNEGDTDSDGLPNFVDVAAAAGVDDPAGLGHSAVFIDYDNDGDQDLYVSNWGGNKLFQNQLIETGSAVFTDVTAFSGTADAGRAITTAWGDFDQDGYLDFYVAKHALCKGNAQQEDNLYRNNGDGTFSNVSDWLCGGATAPCAQLLGLGFTAGWLDYDNDADLDLYLINDNIGGNYYPNVLWRNDGSDGNGGWIFTDVSTAAGADQSINGMGLAVGDYDNDGWLDVAFSNVGPNFLLRNLGNGTFDDVSAAAGIERDTTPGGEVSKTWGTVFFDYNNDQLLDLYIVAGAIGFQANPQPNAMFENNGDGTFADISAASGLDDPERARCASIVDLDNDGFVDVLVGNTYFTPLIFHNKSAQQGNTNHWLTVTVEGTVSNRDGIGTRLWLTTPDGVTQMREINSGPTYGGGDYRAGFFGLGSQTSGDLVVRWPTGVIENIGTVAADQIMHLIEGGGGGGQAPVVSDIPDQVVTEPFLQILLDDFVDDPDHLDSELVWSFSGNTELTLQYKQSRQLLRVFAPGGWTGSETITFTATDPDGLSDSDDAVLSGSGATIAATAFGGNAGLNFIPEEFVLRQNYPNPFNPATQIQYGLPEGTWVTLKVYNTLGEEVTTLVNEYQGAGFKSVFWNGRNNQGRAVSTGIYIYKIEAGNFVQVRKMIFSK